ncbi:Na/Pi cotransporter family protein [Clostridium sp. D2Q-14]|uniref:Na/Pi cotransporter family protein n=1 Tax=Anaeromonas gelatinilytica TaxID=2683194 RepID=UPI00193C2572|nr:Na/Pi symporter [Anaeromonas gelatinilytica]MBS4535940.1 Na/Pi cotransporter family protein [Anaeromonas gelatinilytica]
MEIFNNDNLKIIIEFVSGIIVFLFSIRLLSLTMEENLSMKWNTIIKKLTYKKINCFLIGIIITALIQSSSVFIIIIITLAHSKSISIERAIPLILGSNIGTTVTGQLTAFNIIHFIPYLIILGLILYLYSSNYKVQITGTSILSISLIFIGIKLMGNSLSNFTNSPDSLSYISHIYDNKINSVFFGAGFSTLIHSSSTSIVILQIIAKSGLIPLITSIYILFGLNIGTCIDALIGGLTTNIYGKKVALFHILFNIFGVIIFFNFGNILANVVTYISPDNIPRQIANAHTIFNISISLLILPFVHPISSFLNKIIR